MSYNIHFGYLRYVSDEIIDNLISANDSDRGIGLHRIFTNIKFDKLSNGDLSRDERDEIIGDYYNHGDSTFTDPNMREEEWVSDSRLNENKGYPNRFIDSEFIEEFKKEVKGGREFFRAIKDSYTDNGSYPDIEIVLINTPSFKNSLRIMSEEALHNNELSPKQIDFIKWFYWWGTKMSSKKRNLAAVRFSKD